MGEWAAILFLVVSLTALSRWAWYRQKTEWNNGHCPRCGTAWKRFDTDSQGGIGYKCSCARALWLDWFTPPKERHP